MTTTNEIFSAIRINDGATVHYGHEFGTACGAGFNRAGGRPDVERVSIEVTCKRCAKRMPKAGIDFK
jgi:hypothetical protein